MLRVSSRVVGGWLLACGLLATAVVGACADQKGAIMLAVTTDMKAPKDLIPPPVPGSEALGPPATPDNTGASADTSGDLDFALFGYAPKDCLNIDTETIIDGECKDSFIDSSTLPEFDSAQLGDSTGQ